MAVPAVIWGAAKTVAASYGARAALRWLARRSLSPSPDQMAELVDDESDDKTEPTPDRPPPTPPGIPVDDSPPPIPDIPLDIEDPPVPTLDFPPPTPLELRPRWDIYREGRRVSTVFAADGVTAIQLATDGLRYHVVCSTRCLAVVRVFGTHERIVARRL